MHLLISLCVSRGSQAPGNHETSANFTEYKLRHAGVANYSNTGSALFYSWDFQGVHFLAFNSETCEDCWLFVFRFGSSGGSLCALPAPPFTADIEGGIAEMLAFMAADLAAVNRSATPWVVAYSHKVRSMAVHLLASALVLNKSHPFPIIR